jgi:hypothetical protein
LRSLGRCGDTPAPDSQAQYPHAVPAVGALGWRSRKRKAAPMTHNRVDDYLDSLAPLQRELAAALRQLVRTAAPQATEAFKWSQPVYEQNGPLCWIKAHKAHVSFGFWRGRQLPSADGVLEGTGVKMAHIKLRSADDLQPATLKKLVREAVALNAERGDPTRNP